MGDLNEILSASEKSGSHTQARSQMVDFQQALEECRLVDLGYCGPKFTWTNGRRGPSYTVERLDRAAANPEWCMHFYIVEVSVLARSCSDHNPIHVVYSNSRDIRWSK